MCNGDQGNGILIEKNEKGSLSCLVRFIRQLGGRNPTNATSVNLHNSSRNAQSYTVRMTSLLLFLYGFPNTNIYARWVLCNNTMVLKLLKAT